MPPALANGATSAAAIRIFSGAPGSPPLSPARLGTRMPIEPRGGICSTSRPSRATTSASCIGSPAVFSMRSKGTEKVSIAGAGRVPTGVAPTRASLRRATVTTPSATRTTVPGSKPMSESAAGRKGVANSSPTLSPPALPEQ